MRRNTKQEFKSATVQAAKAAGAGNLPGGVKRMLDKILNPQLDWRTLLAMQIQGEFKNDYTFRTQSRKGADSGYWLPGMDYDTTTYVAIALDVSGSIFDDMLIDFIKRS